MIESDSIKISEYLNQNIFQFPNYVLTDDDRKLIKADKAKWITKKLFRKKFRKTKTYKEAFNEISKKIKYSIERDAPIHFIILFGGYKHFWNDSHPNTDWAELFNLRFMSEFVAPLLKVYSKGVILDYGSEDVIITKMNNYPKKSLDLYAKSFQKLINFYSNYVPPNFSINYIRTSDKYDVGDLTAKIESALPNKIKEWDKLSLEEKSAKLKRSNRSVMFDGENNFSNLAKIEKEKLIEKSKQIEELFYEIEDELIGDYYYGGNNIPLVLSWGLSNENLDHWLTLGSTFASSVDFWIGRGILEVRNDKIVPRIVSKKQYFEIKNYLTKIDIELLSFNKNLTKLEICHKKLNFEK